MIDIDLALRALVQCDGSDLHLKAGAAPMARVNGELVALAGDWPALEPGETEQVLREMLGDGVRLEEFAQRHEIDVSR